MPLSDELREDEDPMWEKIVSHPFVVELGDGVLPEEKFRTYFEQDYLFFKDWVVLLSMGVAKSPDFDSARSICSFLNAGLGGEEGLFRQAFSDMGLSREGIGNLQPLPTTLAYGSYLKSTAYEGDFDDIATALLGIEWPYLDWAQQLTAAGKRPSNRYYQAWIDIHVSREMQDFVAFLRRSVDGAQGGNRQRLREVFHRTLTYEYLFWEMPYRGETWPG